jgi:ubiquinone/menaquinone biosynthesis C-methylase UbiE/Ni2+-binding GTPase involved in maturation of urease and hydrogenase
LRLQLVGGFLGAGKTTLVRALASHLRDRGESVAVITNDQGQTLVDTHLCLSEISEVTEITGGCFCCRFDDLVAAIAAAEVGGATIVIAEAVGSCTDLIATVLSPLAETRGDLELAPLAVVVDPWRLMQVESDDADEDITYLFRKQIQEADVVLMSRADLNPPDLREEIRALAPDAAVVEVSGGTGQGLDDWIAARPQRPATPLAIDYERYARAEALLGWGNGVVHLERTNGFDPTRVMSDFLSGLMDTPVAHVKLTALEPVGLSGSLVRRGLAPVLSTSEHTVERTEVDFIVNARVALPPAELEQRLHQAMNYALPGGDVRWEKWECFRPAPPEPTHRHSFRCGTTDDATCCAAFYDRAEVRYLLGDSLHPGGVELTLRMAERLDLSEGQEVLDVACGRATSLRAIGEVWPVTGVGLDAGADPLGPVHDGARGSNGIELHRGDAHHIPFGDGRFDAVLCECALSTFHDQARALSEIRRVLRLGGRLALSDMVVEGDVPEELNDWVNVGTCLEGALTFSGYEDALQRAGFRIVEKWDASEGLHEMVKRIKRNLLGLALAKATGEFALDFTLDVKEGRALLRMAEQAVRAGVIAYGVYVAERLD